MGMTRMDRIRNEYIRGTAQVKHFGEARPRWFGHVQRRSGHVGRMLKMEAEEREVYDS